MGNTPSSITTSQVKLNKIHVVSNNDKLEIERYFSSKYFNSVGLLLEGERWNPQTKKRNAMISVTNLMKKNSVGKIINLDQFPSLFKYNLTKQTIYNQRTINIYTQLKSMFIKTNLMLLFLDVMV